MTSLSKAAGTPFKTYVTNLEAETMTIDNLVVEELDANILACNVLTVANNAVIVGSIFEPSNGDVAMPGNVSAALTATFTVVNSQDLNNLDLITSLNATITNQTTTNQLDAVDIYVSNQLESASIEAVDVNVSNQLEAVDVNVTGDLDAVTVSATNVGISNVLGALVGNITTVNSTTVNTTNLDVTGTFDVVTVDATTVNATTVNTVDLTVTGTLTIDDLDITTLDVTTINAVDVNVTGDLDVTAGTALLPFISGDVFVEGDLEVDGDVTVTQIVQSTQNRVPITFDTLSAPSTYIRCQHSILLTSGSESIASGGNNAFLIFGKNNLLANIPITNFGHRFMLDLQLRGSPTNSNNYMIIGLYKGLVTLVNSGYSNKTYTNYGLNLNNNGQTAWQLHTGRANEIYLTGRFFFNVNTLGYNGNAQIMGNWQDFREGQSQSLNQYTISGSCEGIAVDEAIGGVQLSLTNTNHTGYNFRYKFYCL